MSNPFRDLLNYSFAIFNESAAPPLPSGPRIASETKRLVASGALSADCIAAPPVPIGLWIVSETKRLTALVADCLGAPVPDGFTRIDVESRVRALQDALVHLIFVSPVTAFADGQFQGILGAMRGVEMLALVTERAGVAVDPPKAPSIGNDKTFEQRIIEAVFGHQHEDWTREQLAGHLGVSRTHLWRQAKKSKAVEGALSFWDDARAKRKAVVHRGQDGALTADEIVEDETP